MFLLRAPEATDDPSRDPVGLAGDFLAQDITKPLGKVVDLTRADLPAPSWESRGLHYHAFGLSRFASPRRSGESAAARRLCQRTLERWACRDAEAIREAVRKRVLDLWSGQGLGTEGFVERLKLAVHTSTGHAPDEALAAISEPLVRRTLDAAVAAESGRGPVALPEITHEELTGVMSRFEEVLGYSEDVGFDGPGARLPLRELAGQLENEWGQKIVEMLVQLIEEPGYHLAGADEGIRQIVLLFEQTLKSQEELAQPLVSTARDAYRRLKTLLEYGRQKKSSPVDDVALMRIYSEARLQGLLLRQTWASFVTLRGNLTDVARDVNYCRGRLEDLARRLGSSAASSRDAGDSQPRCPEQANDSNDPVERFIEGLSAEATADWERIARATVETRFHSLTNVCLKEPGNLANFATALLEAAGDFVCARMPKTDGAELFLQWLGEAESPETAIRQWIEKSAPAAPGSRELGPTEFCIVAAPAGPAGDLLRKFVERAAPGARLVALPDDGDVVIYREFSNLPLAEIEHLGPAGESVHAQMFAAKGLTAHSRADVDFRLSQSDFGCPSSAVSESAHSS
jgi:hypothetical protein